MPLTENAGLITSRSAILKELLRSKADGSALGIWSQTLGEGMFLCTVKDVVRDEDENDIMVMFHDNAFTTPRINSYVLYLSEIERIYTVAVQSLVIEKDS